jgi:hypothetical protein
MSYLSRAAGTLTVTLGTAGSTGKQPGTIGKVSASAPQLNLAAGILDAGDNALTGYTYTVTSGPQF